MSLSVISQQLRAASWMDRAACIDLPVDHFAVSTFGQDQAKRVCTSCPVRWECFTYALETRPVAGVWAGWLWKDGEPWA